MIPHTKIDKANIKKSKADSTTKTLSNNPPQYHWYKNQSQQQVPEHETGIEDDEAATSNNSITKLNHTYIRCDKKSVVIDQQDQSKTN